MSSKIFSPYEDHLRSYSLSPLACPLRSNHPATATVFPLSLPLRCIRFIKAFDADGNGQIDLAGEIYYAAQTDTAETETRQPNST